MNKILILSSLVLFVGALEAQYVGGDMLGVNPALMQRQNGAMPRPGSFPQRPQMGEHVQPTGHYGQGLPCVDEYGRNALTRVSDGQVITPTAIIGGDHKK